MLITLFCLSIKHATVQRKWVLCSSIRNFQYFLEVELITIDRIGILSRLTEYIILAFLDMI